MRALVTGSAGFIGRHFVKELTKRGYDVDQVDVANSHHYMDALTFFQFSSELYDLVVHAAARSPHRTGIDTDAGAVAYNSLLDAAMFHWAINTGQRQVIYLSSSAVYANELPHWPFVEYMGDLHQPFDGYGATKRHGEVMARAARAHGINVAVVRPFSGYGSDQSEKFPFGAFIRRAIRREDPFIIWGDSSQRRDFIHVDDIVAGSLAVLEKRSAYPVNICTGVVTSMRTLADMIIAEVQERDPSYSPTIKVDERAPMGVGYRVGDPMTFRGFHNHRIMLAQGVRRAVKENWHEI